MEDHKANDDRIPSCEFFLASLREEFMKEKCCLICLQVVAPHQRKQHKQSVRHKLLVSCLKREMYPYPCIKCEMRFSTKHDLLHHSSGHFGNLVTDNEYQIFSPVCCYLCRLPFQSEEALDTHCSKSFEHHFRRQMVLEMAIRECVVSELIESNSAPNAAFKERSRSRGAVSPVQEDPKTSLLCTPAHPSVQMGQSSNSSVAVPISNMTKHSKGKNHFENYEVILANTSKSNRSNSADEIPVSDQKSEEPLCSKITSGALTMTGIVATEDASKSEETTSACSTSLTDKSEEKISNINSCNAVGESFCSDQSNGSKIIDTPLRKPIVSELADLNNVPKAVLEESIPRPTSAVPEDHKTNLLCTRTKPSVQTNPFQTYCSICCVSVPTSNMTEHSKGKNHIRNYTALLATNSNTHYNADSETFDCDLKNTSEVPSHSLNKTSETLTTTEILASKDTVRIGDSTITCLQEEFEKLKISVEQDLNDYQVECGTCGGVFQTFNNDVDLSFDLHVQNDPQHALATAVPLDRDAKQLAELVKSSTAPKKESRKDVASKIYHAEGDGPSYCRICFQNVSSLSSQERTQHLEKCNCNAHQTTMPPTQGRNPNTGTVGETPKAEQSLAHPQLTKQINPNSLKFFCQICNKNMTQGDKSCHLKSKKHKANASMSFHCSVCSEEMPLGEKEDHMISQKHKDNASLNFFCKICDKNMTQGDKSSHLMGKLHKANASMSFHCSVCSEEMPLGEKEDHMISQKHKDNASLNFFCKICDKNIAQANKSSHLMGKPHIAKSSLSFHCSVCSEEMTVGEKEDHMISQKHKDNEICDKNMSQANKSSHLKGKPHEANSSLSFHCSICLEMIIGEKANHVISQKHREKAGLTYFCDICNKWMMQGNKSSHLNGREHKATASKVGTFSCGICNKTMSLSNMGSHLQSKQHQKEAEASSKSRGISDKNMTKEI